MSYYLTAPLDELANAACEIGDKNSSRRVEIRGSQEIMTVAKAFNEMASKLQEAETLRQNLLSDVAHELRTPLTINHRAKFGFENLIIWYHHLIILLPLTNM